MNVYPAELEPTRTVPESESAAGERAAGFFGAALWPTGYPGRSELLRLRVTPRDVPAPSVPPATFVDRETGQEIRKPTSLNRIGQWSTGPIVKR